MCSVVVFAFFVKFLNPLYIVPPHYPYLFVYRLSLHSFLVCWVEVPCLINPEYFDVENYLPSYGAGAIWTDWEVMNMYIRDDCVPFM